LETIVKKLYEAMFLVDSAEASADWDGVNATIKKMLDRAEAEIVSTRKWDERRLAYEINGKSRGTYILCYFKAEGEKVRDIERDVQLSEQIMRVLILCAEGRDKGYIEKETPVMLAENQKQKAAQAATESSKMEQEAAKSEQIKREKLEDSKEAEKQDIQKKDETKMSL
jgi:small subunit ribosomal protein S6